jgi:hypothetical protein
MLSTTMSKQMMMIDVGAWSLEQIAMVQQVQSPIGGWGAAISRVAQAGTGGQ